MKTTPKLTKAQIKSWCPQPRGDQEPGHHGEIPALDHENANTTGGYAENRELTEKILEAFKAIKKRDSEDPDTGPRFVLQWRIFPNALNTNSADPNQCGCGCSCGCS
jgi:hypothetical protein